MPDSELKTKTSAIVGKAIVDALIEKHKGHQPEMQTKAAPKSGADIRQGYADALNIPKAAAAPKRNYECLEVAAFVSNDNYNDLSDAFDKALTPFKTVLFCEKIGARSLGEFRFLVIARR